MENTKKPETVFREFQWNAFFFLSQNRQHHLFIRNNTISINAEFNAGPTAK